MKKHPLQSILGGTPEENKEIIVAILTGKEKGAKRSWFFQKRC